MRQVFSVRHWASWSVYTQRVDRFGQRVNPCHIRNDGDSTDKVGHRKNWLNPFPTARRFVAQANITKSVGIAESFEIGFLEQKRQVSCGRGLPRVGRLSPRSALSVREWIDNSQLKVIAHMIHLRKITTWGRFNRSLNGT